MNDTSWAPPSRPRPTDPRSTRGRARARPKRQRGRSAARGSDRPESSGDPRHVWHSTARPWLRLNFTRCTGGREGRAWRRRRANLLATRNRPHRATPRSRISRLNPMARREKRNVECQSRERARRIDGSNHSRAPMGKAKRYGARSVDSPTSTSSSKNAAGKKNLRGT